MQKLKTENECFPSFFKEGWLRPQFCHVALSLRGDGVVNTESGRYFNHLPQIHEKRRFSRILDWLTWIWVLLLSRRRIVQFTIE